LVKEFVNPHHFYIRLAEQENIEPTPIFISKKTEIALRIVALIMILGEKIPFAFLNNAFRI